MSVGYRSHDCSIGNHTGTAFAKGCPGVTPAHTWPDPSRKGTTYTTPERVCTCNCHSRQNLTQPGRLAPPESKGTP